MKLKNVATNEVVELSHDLLWIDEHSWNRVQASVEYSLTGALLIETGVKKAGRFITLEAEDDMAWVRRQDLDTLRGWAAHPTQNFELTFDDGRTFNVVFRHQEDDVIDAKPVTGIPSSDPNSYWNVALKFMEI